MAQIIECVPNFSEGRRPEVIGALVAACQGPGITLLDQHADADHNRLVVTFVGDAAAVKAAVLRAARAAAELIDLDAHQGSHPRMGALDVVPFIPIRDVTMADCVALAEDVGQALGELGIPVYLYEEAARTPARRVLADVRRGEYEGLQADVAAGQRLPDFGPAGLGKAGATAVGARKPLVAFNVNLGTTDVKVARSVANRVREAKGGLRNVRAIGLPLTNRPAVQVSMNLVDTASTPIYRALELVRVEAARYGVPVVGTEIVGLVPQAALVSSAVYYLQVEDFKARAQVLENRIADALAAAGAAGEAFAGAAAPADGGEARPFARMSLGEFADALASRSPAPGGGTAAAVSGALAAGLVAMVARLSQGGKFVEVAEEMARVAREADVRRSRLLGLADADSRAFDAVMAAYKLPKETDAEKAARSQAVAAALVQAAQVPMDVARTTLELLPPAAFVAERGNRNSASDAAVAAHLLRTAVEGALLNVEINLGSLARLDAPAVAAAAAELREAVAVARNQLHQAIPAILAVAEANVRG